MINWPRDLIDDIAKRRSVLYLGSGVSANSSNSEGKKPATWNTFLKNIITLKESVIGSNKGIIEELIQKEDYLTACEIIVETIGSREFGELAADEFRRPGYKPNKIHEIIFSLDSKVVITPNIDKIYEQYANSASNGTVVVKKYNEDIAKYLRSSDYIIIKAHGCVDDSDHIVFTHKQYSDARYKYATFYKMLDALMLTNTFIFIGCGIADPDIQLVLENYNFTFPGCRPHYFVTAKGTIHSEVIKSLLRNRNIKVITYDNYDGKHKELVDGLTDLTKKLI